MFFQQNHLENFFSPNFYVDTFQTTKKILTDRVITDQVLNRAAHNYIRAQTEFAKMLLDNFFNISKHALDTSSNYWFPKQQTHTHKGD